MRAGDLRIAARREGQFIESARERRVKRAGPWDRCLWDSTDTGPDRRRCGTARRRTAVGKKAAAVIAGAAAGPLGAGEHDETGQVRRLRSEPVKRPGAEAGPAELLRTGVHQDLRRGMVHRLGLHRADETDVVHDAAPVCGSISLISMPLRPCRANLYFGPSRAEFGLMKAAR